MFRSLASLTKKLTANMSSNTGARLVFPTLPRKLQGTFKPGQMLTHQDRVAKLPVPPLQQTLDKYLTSVEPLLSVNELNQTRAVISEFGKPGGLGEQLQQKLIERANTHENWLADWWDSVAYLAFRDPVTVNVSPSLIYPIQDCQDRNAYVRTVAKHVMCHMKVAQLVFSESLPPEIYRDKPYCMSQYFKLYGCRIPGAKEDTVQRNYPNTTNHMVIMRKGRMYKVTIFGKNKAGEIDIVPPSHIINEIHKILDDANEPAPFPVGVLTTEHRDTWYKARQTLIEDPVNAASLKDMQDAMFIICLDQPNPNIGSATSTDFVESINTLVANRCLHGNGTAFNTCNRWFDSTSQIIIGEDGGSGTILEHSACDGSSAIFVNTFSMDLIDRCKDYDMLSDPSSIDPATIEPTKEIKWNISSTAAKYIEDAKNNIDKLIDDTDLRVVCFRDFGKNVPKSFKLSPDGFIQCAIQLAYYKMYGRPTAAYESGATRWFKYGRTDTIRSTTNAAFTFVKTMCDPRATSEAKAKALTAAVKAHSNYTIEAVSGQAVDRHLLGLKLLAAEAGMETPEVFKDVAFSRSLHFCLSTSQVPCSNYDVFLTFGAVVPDGYGVCYNPQESKLLMAVNSFKSCPQTDSVEFSSKLKESMRDMRDMLVATKPLKAKM